MKNIFILSLLLISLSQIYTQSATCCSAHDQFAGLTTDMAFVNKHDEPIPFTYFSENGKMITFQCPDGKMANAFEIPAKKESDDYLFVFHEWWGLNDYIKEVSEKFYTDLDKKVNVIAIDLYDGQVTARKDSAQTFMNSLNQERAISIIMGAINKAGPDAKVATVGWCMGGGFSLQASILLKSQGVACVMYYGFPETDKEKLKDLEADVLMIWPNQDKWINNTVVTQFKTDMLSLNKNLKVEEYTADHAFANPSNPKYNKEFADDAYSKSLIFLKSGFDMK
ncbi:MAG: dienelactone hydrolase family protein [Chitinophagales bacterium]